MKTGKKVTIDDLASLIKHGFDHVDDQFKVVNHRLTNLESGQEAILLRLDNVAYRFELVDLEKRVYRLETKTGISRK